jgi:NAD(P)-dependent dehydrogenase (short-subunit alcohol dehydrogenase family)
MGQSMSSAQKVVVVTGAAGGLGSAAVALFAQRGVAVLCVDRNADALTEVVGEIAAKSGGDLLAAAGDIGDAADAERLIGQAVAHWGGLDGVFNIAGVEGRLAPIVDTPVTEFDDVMHVNVRGTWLSMKFALPHLEARGGGVIVNVGSYQATHGKANCSAYSGSKHAIVGMTRSVALEYATRNVRANVVCPGAMDTRMIRTMMQSLHPEDPSKGERQLLADIPQGRMGRTSEVASVGAWMILDAPEHLTGQVLTVDGGKSAA